MAICAVCGSECPGNLCDECAAELDTPLPFVAEQVLSAAVRPADGILIDAWGRLHPLEARMPVGRQPVARGISLIHASVSRKHAELVLDGGTWRVRDLDSANGIRVNDEPVTAAPLAHGDRVTFGAVGFYFVIDDGHRSSAVAGLGSRTLRPEDAPRAEKPATPTERTDAGLPTLGFELIEAPAGGGGYLLAVGKKLMLTDTQLALLRMLATRMHEEEGTPTLVRGFVPSGQLICDLPWDAKEPDESHLKQLVRRIRRAFDGIGLGGAIESRRGFGYRLRLVPRR